MKEPINLNNKFLEYFHEQEGFALRSERFYEDFVHSISKDHIDANWMILWLQAAYTVGAEDMAKDIASLPEINKENVTQYIRGVFKNEESNS